MSTPSKLGTILSAILLVSSSSTSAETSATAFTDLHLRAGPAVCHDITGVIPASQSVTVDGCLDDSNRCRVGDAGVSGWASGDYLTTMLEAPI